jgi:hypothetical protein
MGARIFEAIARSCLAKSAFICCRKLTRPFQNILLLLKLKNAPLH